MLTALFDFPRFDQAKCSPETAELFFPDNRGETVRNIEFLQSTCASCVHQSECLEYAIENDIKFGFWGGKTATERQELAPAQKKKEKKETRNLKQYKRLQAQGWSVSAIAESSGVAVASVQRTLDRAKKKGLTK